VSFPLEALPTEVVDFLTARHLATLTTLRADGRPHVAPVGFTYDPNTRLARVICSGTSRKALNVAADARVAICQVDGGRWLTVEGRARVETDVTNVTDAEARYTGRYQAPRPNTARVVIVVDVERIMGRA
jgi:F420H(2)-dependent biliverdin reductase